MQPAAPELIAGLCPANAEIEIYNEKETEIPLDRHWDLVFFSYLDPFYEHTKVLSALLRRAGMKTAAGGRHASRFPDDCGRYFDAVVIGEPEGSVGRLIADFGRHRLQKVYSAPPVPPSQISPYRYDLVDLETNRVRVCTTEASRGCPFSCTFCVLTGREGYRYRPVKDVIRDIETRMTWNRHYLGCLSDTFMFYDNNLGGNPRYLRELCESLRPLRKTWGCSLTFNVLEDEELIRDMGRAGCRFIYTGLESLSPTAIESMNKRQNRLKHLDMVIRRAYSNGIILSFGLIVGTDGDTNEYLERIPEYLSDLRFYSLTFIGIMCPYPGTPFFRAVVREGRLLPGVTSRDLDTYTVCHRPKFLHPSEVVEHYKRLCRSIGSLPNVFRHFFGKIGMSSHPGYKLGLLVSSAEISSIRHNLLNEGRTFIAGLDPLEQWDRDRMAELGIVPQAITSVDQSAGMDQPFPTARAGTG
jgi:radical SAM superfamily enzyme YgiQ (UPF0313 family)